MKDVEKRMVTLEAEMCILNELMKRHYCKNIVLEFVIVMMLSSAVGVLLGLGVTKAIELLF